MKTFKITYELPGETLTTVHEDMVAGLDQEAAIQALLVVKPKAEILFVELQKG
jgi:hypothetical protein